ncbi:unnamed protein product [Cladocopium goreaui]|uniref:Prolyl 4-hydroxylase alpha subunit Fe(2+) 2OG dioxygenase domain-containing protein n=1 Tax=Cladocopium goreaui TaxID=2562237 RepID=A0A9P1DNX1_9DINO|nr:unnamed protein product [Cladocopium goreaui]
MLRHAAPAFVQRSLGGCLWRLFDGALSAGEVKEVLSGVAASPYFGRNRSGHDFYHGTEGFSLVFRSAWRAQVEQQFPYFQRLFSQTLHPECNCFYLTVLFARRDGQRYHTDDFFESYGPNAPRPSDLVSVVYCTPEAIEGGELLLLNVDASSPRIHRGREPPETILAQLAPSCGRLVHFDGRLLHGVAPWRPAQNGDALAQRVSVVQLGGR